MKKHYRPKPWALDGTPVVNDYDLFFDKKEMYRNDWKKTDMSISSKKVTGDPLYDTFSLRVFHNKGQNFSNRTPEDIEMLLSLIFGEPVILTGIEAQCLDGNGYTEWFFHYRKPAADMVVPMKAEFYDKLRERDKTFAEDMKIACELQKELFTSFIV